MNVLVARALRGDPEFLRPMLASMEWVVTKMSIPSSLLVFPFGVLLVVEGGYEFNDLFVILGIAGAVATILVGATVLSPRFKKIDDAMNEHGTGSAVAQQLVSRTILIARLDLVMLFVLIGIVVTKPTV